jgi:hypothetical protein
MKNNNQPAASKLVKRFDNDLKALLLNDLKAFKAKMQDMQQAPQVQTATAA